MQKYLLTLAAAAMAVSSVNAADVTLSAADAADVVGTFVPEKGNTKDHYQPVESLKIGDYTFTFKAGEDVGDSSSPALYHVNSTPTIRLYRGSQMTISFPADVEVGSVIWELSSIKGVDQLKVNSGECVVYKDDKKVIWNNSEGAGSITFTLPMDKGSDNANPNMQIKGFIVSPDFMDKPIDPTHGDFIYVGLVDNADDWTFNDGQLPEGLEYVWSWDGKYGLKATSFVDNKPYVVDAWAISPVVDLKGVKDASVSLSQAANYYKGSFDELTFFGAREVGTNDWVEIKLPIVPTSDSWTYVESGDASLAAFEGKQIEFGFNYICKDKTCGTWEIKNFRVKGDTSSVAEIVNENVPAVYFDLNGRRVAEPSKGLFIKIQGSKATKVIVK